VSLRANTAIPSSQDSNERDAPLRHETSTLTGHLTPGL
jgi:hypothetical protein